MMARWTTIIVVMTTLPAGLSACGFDDPVAPTGAGLLLYSEPLSSRSTFTCATCHALEEPAENGIRRPGHTLGDATRRATYKNGQLTEMLDAANSCRDEWMNLADPWTANDPEWKALYAFLDRTAVSAMGQAPLVVSEVVAPPTDMATLLSGNPDTGLTVFNKTCAGCHGEGAVGTQRAPQLAGVGIDPDTIARRVRTSGQRDSAVYTGLTGGVMPFWSASRLSDAELLDIVAWVAMSELPGMPMEDTVIGDDADVSDSSDDADDTADADDSTENAACLPNPMCDQDHPRRGWQAEMQPFSHGVMGTATIIDGCTICLESFNFDGAGIDVRIYSGDNGDYGNGVSMSDDLQNFPIGYDNATLRIDVPDGLTLDQVDGISVWCVPVGTSFGDGLFQAP